MKFWKRFKTAFKYWVKRNLIDNVPVGMEDEFSSKYRRRWKKNQ
jgi:hypothetical protein